MTGDTSLANGGQTFDDFYARHAKAVFAYTMAILRVRQDAEDVVQEVFLQVWKQRETYDCARGSVTAWLIAIARSRAIDRLRAARTSTAREEEASYEFADVADVFNGIVNSERSEFVRRAVAELPFQQRRLLEFAYDEGLSHSAIATVTNQPLGTIKSHIRRALTALRDRKDAPAPEPPRNSGDNADVRAPFTIMGEQNLQTLPLARDVVNRSLNERLAGLRIMIVDDDPETLRLTSAVLQRFGAVPDAHCRSRTALQRIQLSWPDVMIIDLDMPEEDGYSFLGKTRALAKNQGRRVPPAAAFTAFAG